jgi:uncharacterized membrane protein
LQDRLESLEKTVANLARDLRALRAVVDRLERERGIAAAAVDPDDTRAPIHAEAAGASGFEPPRSATLGPSGPPRERPAVGPALDAHLEAERREAELRLADRRAGAERRSLDLESLIGRYGTLALASLTILLGAGAFLSWAIAHGKIGPGMRVFLGGLGAAAVAVVGWRLRARGSQRYGSTLLALALALVHVDAWGAGPYLQLVSSPVALSVAALASIALAVLAWVGDEEALFSVGVGGALVAPFVTSGKHGSVLALLVYGYVVLACGLAALRGRAWRTAVMVTTAGAWLYVATASATTLGTDAQAYAHDYPAVFAVAVAWTALLVTRGAWGARVARSALVALFGTIAAQAFDRSPAADLVVLAALGTATAYATALATVAADGDRPRQPLFTAAVLPLALGGVAVAAVRDTSLAHTLVALAWTGAACVAAYVQPAALPTHAMVGGIASGAALLFALEDRAVASCVALAAHAAALSVLLRRIHTRLLAVPIALGLTIVTVWTFQQLLGRAAYAYTPFLTTPSLAAAAMSAAWLVVSWNAYRAELVDAGPGSVETRTAVRLAGSVVTFMWGNTELAHAYSADVATFLLILYYAVVGVAAIFVGRARGIRILRHVGLGLAIFAALKAIAQASSLAIGLRVGGYLLAGLFLLAVAYWYRDREPARRNTALGDTLSTDPDLERKPAAENG